MQQQASKVRRALEPQWQSLTEPVSGWTEWIAALVVFLLPPLASVVAGFAWPRPLAPDEMILRVALPALMPGGMMWVWSIACKATVLRVGQALAATPPAKAGGAPGCRNCGAPLTVEPNALGASCAFCGADSIIQGVALTAAKTKLRSKLLTLDDALRLLRTRRLLLGFGAVAVMVPTMGIGMLVWAAMRMIF